MSRKAGKPDGQLVGNTESKRENKMGLVPMVIEQTNRGERAYDIYTSARQHHLSGHAD